VPFWLPILPYRDYKAACDKVDLALPGRTALIHDNFKFRGSTKSESKNWSGGARFTFKDQQNEMKHNKANSDDAKRPRG